MSSAFTTRYLVESSLIHPFLMLSCANHEGESLGEEGLGYTQLDTTTPPVESNSV